MKKILYIFFICFASFSTSFGQNNININPELPQPKVEIGNESTITPVVPHYSVGEVDDLVVKIRNPQPPYISVIDQIIAKRQVTESASPIIKGRAELKQLAYDPDMSKGYEEVSPGKLVKKYDVYHPGMDNDAIQHEKDVKKREEMTNVIGVILLIIVILIIEHNRSSKNKKIGL